MKNTKKINLTTSEIFIILLIIDLFVMLVSIITFIWTENIFFIKIALTSAISLFPLSAVSEITEK